ncbi:MAG TPA: peptidogalycan biosysnthesis protein [Polyangiales bacterium]
MAISSLAEVSEAEWNALVDANDPFTHYGFLRLLETSGSVGRGTGWTPCHVLVRRDGQLLAALPLYLKQHSYGEFIFDFGWAQAAYRAGIPYYPKLVSAVPLTPATGRRLLLRTGEDVEALTAALVAGAEALMSSTRASSLHVLFCGPDEAERLERQGLHARKSIQYHLTPPDSVQTFADYVGALRHSARKQVRREREQARASGVALSMRPFAELSRTDLDAMWGFYNATIDQHGSTAYLTRAFFDGLVHNPHAFAAMAHDGVQPVAGALFFVGQRSMFGRYWGAAREIPMLHFELCYYFPIEWGLARGIRHFEAGAQGEHKIKRGFLPAFCYSAHRAAHPGLDRAIGEFVEGEQDYVGREREMLEAGTPFKRGEE